MVTTGGDPMTADDAQVRAVLAEFGLSVGWAAMKDADGMFGRAIRNMARHIAASRTAGDDGRVGEADLEQIIRNLGIVADSVPLNIVATANGAITEGLLVGVMKCDLDAITTYARKQAADNAALRESVERLERVADAARAFNQRDLPSTRIDLIGAVQYLDTPSPRQPSEPGGA